MKVNNYITKRYLSARENQNLDGNKAIIDSVFESELQDGQKKLCIRFKDIEDSLILNQTNLRTLTGAFGDDSDNWINQKVEIRIVNVTYEGELTKGIQLKPM